jgi:ABC-type bacteriocin/lantibiotic exporter with double-glycine peptidase domain
LVSTFILLAVWGLMQDAPTSGPLRCGRYALMVASTYVDPDSGDQPWEDILPDSQAPFSLADLERGFHRLGLETLATEWSDPRTADFGCVAVLHVRVTEASLQPDHFVVCLGADRSAVLLCDYPLTPVWVSREKLQNYWSGTALYVARPGDGRIDRLQWQMRFSAFQMPLTVALASVIVVLAFGQLRGCLLAVIHRVKNFT